MTPDEIFMTRALELAQRGIGYVSPNPRVGCVIVHDNQIIGEGWHQKFGEAHAEVNAVNSVADVSLLRESTVYVNLEPCSHFGKTPPCADLLIKHSVKKVVIANKDSNPLVAGEGIKKLKDAGVEVVVGVLEREGLELNKRFFTSMAKQRPYIILKWAQTTDGFIAQKNYESKWISNELSRQLVHRWRSEEDAVLVGTKTATHDNPSLTVRDWTGRNPTRIVIDRFLRLHDHLHLFDGKEKTLCYNVLRHEEKKNLSLVRIDEENFIIHLVNDLPKQKIQSVLVEGGAQTLQLFIDLNLWDEARVFTSPRLFHEGISAPKLNARKIGHEQVQSDLLEIFTPL
ncbi:MAG: bifunctional diaminohydroxyphosphoribosylaminopyrimidine deaminase/5-amino-6-(5-phosphoribosylamino)uracil reductase RibD [Bacteroidetes bacterium]|nr:bifunctional diaminohydroxyphosphoribosylaminopyrimidine deaminase/5-amino-6-(5-phosphoribosylamino)uracil reductase RibD [Bacteroidota bacterium]